MLVMCDECFTKHPVQKITRYKNEYLCEKCLGKRLSDKYSGKTGQETIGLTKWPKHKANGIWLAIKNLFK